MIERMPTAPSFVDPSLDLFAEIAKLRRAKKALILAHYYQDPDIQDIADHLGDSLELAKRARDAKDAEVILFSPHAAHRAVVDHMAVKLGVSE